MSSNNIVEIKLQDLASWKIKILTVFVGFLNRLPSKKVNKNTTLVLRVDIRIDSPGGTIGE